MSNRILHPLCVSDDALLIAIEWQVLDGIQHEHGGRRELFNVKPLRDLLDGMVQEEDVLLDFHCERLSEEKGGVAIVSSRMPPTPIRFPINAV